MSDIDAKQTLVPRAGPPLPEDVLIILPVRNLVLFPGVVMPVTANREMTVAGAREAIRTGRKVGFLLQKDAALDAPGPDDFHRVGGLATLLRDVAAPDGTHHLIAQGEGRFRVLDFLKIDAVLAETASIKDELKRAVERALAARKRTR